MKYKKQYKEVFSQIHPPREVNWEELCVKRRRRRTSKQIVSVAAAIAVLTVLCLAAYAANFCRLRDLLLPRQDPTQAKTEQNQQTPFADTISLVGYTGTAETKALSEWKRFLETYDDGGALERIGNDLTGFEDQYGLYYVYTQEMADKLDSILEKYRLKLHTSMFIVSPAELLAEQVGGNFYGENRFGGAYLYEDGTFGFDGEIELEGYGLLDYQFLRAVQGSFTETQLTIGRINDYTEWTYVTQDGTVVTLALSGHKALVIVDLLDSFVTINVLAGTETPDDDVFSHGPLSAEDLERFADSFTFRLLTPALPANEEILRQVLQQEAESEDNGDFRMITGMEEWQAQAFFAELSRNIENDDRQAVAEKLLYPAAVTYWQTSETGTNPVEITVSSPEEFLLYYDEIFTENLWWDDILTSQYTKEHADLFPDNGMVGAAGGAIRFALTKENGIKVFTVQNSDGCSIRYGGRALLN